MRVQTPLFIPLFFLILLIFIFNFFLVLSNNSNSNNPINLDKLLGDKENEIFEPSTGY
jgi:hypothetical protein